MLGGRQESSVTSTLQHVRRYRSTDTAKQHFMPVVLVAGFLGCTGVTNSYCRYGVLRNESANKDKVCSVLFWFPFLKHRK